MRKNKVTSYLLYAIGEITLVVLGILIAVYINDWNQSNIDTKREYKALLDLQAEFKANYLLLVADKAIKLKGIDYTSERISAIRNHDNS